MQFALGGLGFLTEWAIVLITFVSNLICGMFQDDIEAYKTQNKFLNSEIYQLTRLWRNSSEQEKSLMVKVGSLKHQIKCFTLTVSKI